MKSVPLGSQHGTSQSARVPSATSLGTAKRHISLTLLTLVVGCAAACRSDAPPSNERTDPASPETLEVRRQLFELDPSVPLVIEALVTGAEPSDGADVIVLLTGNGRSAFRFLPFLPRLAEAGFRAIALNPRGVDGSEGPLNSLTMHDLADDVARVVEQIAVGPVHVLGHGFGNRVARCLATDRPELVRSVILLAAGGQVPGEPEAREAVDRLYAPEISDDEKHVALQTALFAPSSDASVWVDLPAYPEVRMAQSAADQETPREEWLAGGTAPMLVIQGFHDRLAPPANGRWLLERFSDRVRLVELSDSGHALLPEQPDEILAAIREFVQQL